MMKISKQAKSILLNPAADPAAIFIASRILHLRYELMPGLDRTQFAYASTVMEAALQDFRLATAPSIVDACAFCLPEARGLVMAAAASAAIGKHVMDVNVKDKTKAQKRELALLEYAALVNAVRITHALCAGFAAKHSDNGARMAGILRRFVFLPSAFDFPAGRGFFSEAERLDIATLAVYFAHHDGTFAALQPAMFWVEEMGDAFPVDALAKCPSLCKPDAVVLELVRPGGFPCEPVDLDSLYRNACRLGEEARAQFVLALAHGTQDPTYADTIESLISDARFGGSAVAAAFDAL